MGVMCGGDNLCINMHTPYVAATSFFAGEVEIFDFVTERVKRCIAAIIVRYGFYILCNKHCCWGGELVKGFSLYF